MKRDILRVFTTNLIKAFVTLMTAFFIPILLPVEQYGYYKIFVLYSSYIGVSHLGFCDGIFLKYGGNNFDCISKQQLASEQKTFMIYEGFLTVLVTLIGVLRHDYIIVLFGLSFLPTTMISFYTYLYQSMGYFKEYARVYNINSVLLLILNAILVFILKIDKGIYYAGLSVVVNYTVFLFAYTSFRKKNDIRGGKISFYTLTEPIKLGVLLMLGNMSYALFASIDKWFVKQLMDIECFAYYSFGEQLLSIINMFANPIGLTFYSYMSKKLEKKFEYIMKTRMISILFFMLTGVFVIKWIVTHFIGKYIPAVPVIEILFLAQVFQLLNTVIYVNLFKVYKMQKKYLLNVIAVLVVSICMNALCFVVMGKNMTSFAVATLISMIIWACCNLRSFAHLKLDKKAFGFVVFCSIAYLVFSQLQNTICGGLIYFICWLALVKLFMKDNYDYYIGQVLTIIKRIKRGID